MKKVLRILLFGFFLSTVSILAFGQKSNVLKVNLFSPLIKSGSFFYERVLNDDMSAQLGFFFMSWTPGSSDTKFGGFGVTPEFRYYLSESSAPKGIFIAPFVRYQKFSLEVESVNSEADLTVFGGGLLVGAQTLLKDLITIEAFIGPSYGFGSIDVKAGDESDFDFETFDGFGARGGITIGIAF
ncbi:MAG: DUF3575 domain-containing protein [Bacteroidetes bacterium]|nr:DUF3575 domain-containing protein [Bacteroidota bacterium]